MPVPTTDGRKLKMGMVGGGEGSFIGPVHRKAALLNESIEMVAGAFDAEPERGRKYGVEKLMLDPERCYGNYEQMLEAEAELPTDERIDFVTIATPNNLHFPIAKAFLEGGFHVACEKPVTISLDEALELRDIIHQTSKVFALAHNYTCFQMVKQARAMVAAGDLGDIIKIVVQYPQGWLVSRLELEGHMQASWRTDPAQSGPAGCLGDIGTHAANMAEYIGGLRIDSLCSVIRTVVSGRRVDDDVSALLRFDNGAVGVLQSSQVLAGKENDFNIWVHGKTGSLWWRQENPNYLFLCRPGKPAATLSRGNGYLYPESTGLARVGPGHHEGYIESFANFYLGVEQRIRIAEGENSADKLIEIPGIEEGIRGMAFIETMLESSKAGSTWIRMKK